MKNNEGNIQEFFNEQFGEIRGIEIDGKAYVVGADIANCLGYTNPRKALKDHVRSKYKTRNESLRVNGTCPILISEPGIYQLIFFSKMPDAEEFQED